MDGMNTCDECRRVYDGTPYYTFLPEGCGYDADVGEPAMHFGCTANTCPACTGPFLVPDRPDDPRRPVAEDPHARAAMDALIAEAMRTA